MNGKSNNPINLQKKNERRLSGIARRATTDQQAIKHALCIIKSINNSNQLYVGCTQDLKKRLSNHNSGTTPHTEKYMPWELAMYLAFNNKERAIELKNILNHIQEEHLEIR